MSSEGALNRLAKWRSVLAGWQLGTRAIGDPECDAVRNHREATLLLRAETTTIARLLLEKGAFTLEEFDRVLGEEADALSKMYEAKFPGMSATDEGIRMEMPEAQNTLRGFRP